MNLDAWWRARPWREKLMLGGAAAAVLLACGDALVTRPLAAKLARAEAKNRQLGAQIDAQAKAKPGSGNDALRTQEAALRERLEQARGRVAEQRARVADTTRLPETLRAITATVGSARLLELDLAGEVEGPPAATPMPTTVAAGKPRLHRLPITLKVAGSWQELQLLLTQFERHAQALQWTSMTLDNAEWPSIQLTLKAHVLSTAPRWGAAEALSGSGGSGRSGTTGAAATPAAPGPTAAIGASTS